MRELENGRLVRLLTKFGFINERPECVSLPHAPPRACIAADDASLLRFDHDPRWAETGDRYLIKLFRDYVFHQVDETGRPVTDLSHVLTALNKVRTRACPPPAFRCRDSHLTHRSRSRAQLDAGIDEKLMLVSRDEQSCLIVSYREVSTLSPCPLFRSLTGALNPSRHACVQIKNCVENAFADLSRS